MKIQNLKNKIIIGTAQLLTNYGITNFSSKKKEKLARNLLNYCIKNNLNKFDTASGYKNEKYIGDFFYNNKTKNFTPKITTKISSLKNLDSKKKFYYLERSINISLKNLNNNIDTILFHDQKDIPYTLKNIDKIRKLFNTYKINNYGYSIYDLKFLNLLKIINYNITVQVPINIINDIFLKNSLKKNFNIVSRSIFLQGILLNQKIKPGYKKILYDRHQKYIQYIKDNNINPIELSSIIFKSKKINNIIVGVDNKKQLEVLLNTRLNYKNYNVHIRNIKKIFNPIYLNDPRKW